MRPIVAFMPAAYVRCGSPRQTERPAASDQAELVEYAQLVSRTPAVGRLAVAKGKDLHVSHREAFSGRRVPEEITGMGTREIHDGDQACRRDDRFDHLAVD